MPRFILIDNRSGHIAGDTTEPDNTIYGLSDPMEICRRLQPHCRRVDYLGPHDTGLRLYVAREGFPSVRDRRNAHVIEAVEIECALAMLAR